MQGFDLSSNRLTVTKAKQHSFLTKFDELPTFELARFTNHLEPQPQDHPQYFAKPRRRFALGRRQQVCVLEPQNVTNLR